FFFFYCFYATLSLPSFPTRRSSDLMASRSSVLGGHRHQELAVHVNVLPHSHRPDRQMNCLTAQELGGEILNVVHALLHSLPSVRDRKSTRLNSSHVSISYAVFCLKK